MVIDIMCCNDGPLFHSGIFIVRIILCIITKRLAI